MRIALIFFIFLFSKALGVGNFAYAGNYLPEIVPAGRTVVENTVPAPGETANEHSFLIKDASGSGEATDLVYVEDEDEDDNSFRKQIFTARFFATFCHAFILGHRCSDPADLLSFYRHPFYTGSCNISCKRVYNLIVSFISHRRRVVDVL